MLKFFKQRVLETAVVCVLFILPSCVTPEGERANDVDALTVFKQVCLETAPDFDGAKRIARRLGLTEFRDDLVGQQVGGEKLYAYNFSIPENEYGLYFVTQPGQIALEAGPSQVTNSSCTVEYFEPVGGLTKTQAQERFFQDMIAVLGPSIAAPATDDPKDYINFWLGRMLGQVRLNWAGDVETASGARVSLNLWVGDVN